MSDTKNLETMVQKSASLIQASRDRIQALEAENQSLKTEKAASEKAASAVRDLSPRIIDNLISAGRLSEADRDRAMTNLANPVKVAEELVNVLELASPSPIGSVEAPASAKSTKAASTAIQEADDRYRQLCGLA